MSAAENQSRDEADRLRRQSAEMALLAGGLAHEIRNPLSTITMNVELLGEDVPEDGLPQSRRLHQKIDLIRKECGRLESILNAFLQFTRAGELHAERLSLNQLVSEFIEFFAPRAAECGIDISPHLAPDLPAVEADPSLLRQVLQNLARNSLDAMEHGGTIELQTRRDGNRVQLEFIDSGTGMDAALCEKVFEAFFSRKKGGSGLGLPTVRKIVQAHGGTVACDSEPGRGTRITISLPAAG
jgi:signal transduction histidine kinase